MSLTFTSDFELGAAAAGGEINVAMAVLHSISLSPSVTSNCLPLVSQCRLTLSNSR
jgi:hypothetical protein